jgi:4-hydroxy-3-methylbut-2-enyl diphosphate reductase
MKSFNVPIIYRSPMISAIKANRKAADKLKKDFTPTLLDFGPLKIYLARHFGFCYGVENAIEISFRAVEENPGKRIFLLSEMIHNPQVNDDLQARGVQFLMDTHGKQLVAWEELSSEDVVIIPAFGTTLEIADRLSKIGISPIQYNTTCPFVERVWNKAEQIGEQGYTVIIHGKPKHEETRATFSHSRSHTPSVVINDMQEAINLAAYIRGEKDASLFLEEFKGQY